MPKCTNVAPVHDTSSLSKSKSKLIIAYPNGVIHPLVVFLSKRVSVHCSDPRWVSRRTCKCPRSPARKPRLQMARPGKGSFQNPNSFTLLLVGNELPLSGQGNRRSHDTPHLLLTHVLWDCPPYLAVKRHARARFSARSVE